MQGLILLLIVSVLVVGHLVNLGWLATEFKYLPEILSLTALVYVVLRGSESRFANIKAAYWIILGAFVVTLLFGSLMEGVPPGPVFAGIRNYFAALPLFLLPAVHEFSERQLRSQLRLLAVLCCIQLPIAYQQRMATVAAGMVTGDYTTGTLIGSGILSIFLVAAAAMLTAFYMHRRIALRTYLLLLCVILAPTTINETKVTLVLAPLAVLTVVWFGSAEKQRFLKLAGSTLAVAAFLVAFVAVYDYFVAPRWDYGLMDFFKQEGRVEGYLFKGSSVGDTQAGRLDWFLVPLSELSRNPVTLAFGLGIGNASDSALGLQFTGEHFERFILFGGATVSIMLLETGLFGLVCGLLAMLMLFGDARRVAGADTTIHGAIALGMVGVLAVYFVSVFYASIHLSAPHAYLFAFYAGVVASHRMRTAGGAIRMMGIARDR
jgi:hypothetical protein